MSKTTGEPLLMEGSPVAVYRSVGTTGDDGLTSFAIFPGHRAVCRIFVVLGGDFANSACAIPVCCPLFSYIQANEFDL
jgi:hypothetical protein